MELEAFREDYDWRNVLSYAGLDECQQGTQPAPSAVGEPLPDGGRFGMADVEEVIAAHEGEHDGDNWLCVLKLKDGRLAYIEAGCDYTGWDCQAGGSAWVANDLPNLIRWAMTDPSRARLKLELPEAL